MNTKLEEFCLLFAAGLHLAGSGTVKEQLADLEEAVENNLDWEGLAYYPYESFSPSLLLGEIYNTYTTLASSLRSSGLLGESQEIEATRRLYASHALQGVLSTVTVVNDVTPTWAAKNAFKIANAMMEEEKRQEPLYGS